MLGESRTSARSKGAGGGSGANGQTQAVPDYFPAGCPGGKKVQKRARGVALLPQLRLSFRCLGSEHTRGRLQLGAWIACGKLSEVIQKE